MDINKLSLNLNKSKVIMFGNFKENSELFIYIDGVIDRVSETTFF